VRTVSARFLAAIRDSHDVSIRATITPPGGASYVPDVIGGQVVQDLDAQIRRRATLEVAFSLAESVDVIRTLPFGGYAALERGILYGDGTTERVALGNLRVDSVSWDAEEGRATLTLSDRWAQIADAAFTSPWTPNGSKPSDAIVATIQDVFGNSIAYHVSTTPATETALADVLYDEQRGEAVANLASSIGADAYFDALGDFVLAKKPTGNETPVWTLDAGADGSLMEAGENLDRTSVRNGVAVRGQPSADVAPIFSLATDSDPNSPTLWGGPFGKVPLIVNLQSVQDQATADSTAASLLRLRLGLTRVLTLRGLPNPALEVGDPVTLVFPDERTETQVVHGLTIPLDVTSPLELTTSSQWRPPSLAELTPRRVRVYSGASAWRELEGVG
jgi:Domain of unknown function (DUF5047)